MIIDEQTGVMPHTCPWFASEDDLSQDVMRLHAMQKAGVPLPEMSARLTDAFAFYANSARATQAARELADARERELKNKGKR